MQTENYKSWFWLLLDVALGVLILIWLFAGLPAALKFKDSLSSASVINVVSEGKTTVSPDIAEVSFSVVSRGKNPQELADMNNSKMSAVIDNLKAQGVADADIKTTSYDLSPDYQYDRSTQRSFITGYTLTQTVHVKIRDLAKVAVILGGVTPLGVNQIGGINFKVDNEDAALAAARANAIAKAKAKAQDMAKASGVSLGRLLSISEFGGVQPFYYDKAMLGMGGPGPAAAPTIQPGTQDVTLNVSLTYELR